MEDDDGARMPGRRGRGHLSKTTGGVGRYTQRPETLRVLQGSSRPRTVTTTPHVWSLNTQNAFASFMKDQRLQARSQSASSREHGVRGRGHEARGRGHEARGRGHEARGRFHSQSADRRPRYRTFILDKERLIDLAKGRENILMNVYLKKREFASLFKSKLNGPESGDTVVLLVKIIALLNQTAYEQTKKKLLREINICDSGFLDVLSEYLLDLPDSKEESNHIYWQDQVQFWNNFFEFIELLVETSAAAATKLRTLLEGTARRCVEQLTATRGLLLPFETREVMEIISTKLRREREQVTKEKQVEEKGPAPPESFRELSVVPRSSELMDLRPFLRPNIVKGGYSDVEHYLDVQFRLLREDCYGPLRDGIFQYMNEPLKGKYDNIRVYHNVKFTGVYVSDSRIGSMIQLDHSANRFLSRVNWAHSKRFIYGSLLLLTKDNCKSFIVCTILDREIRYIERGQIPVSIVGDSNNIDFEESYTMIESEVYFEPYLHVLNALQHPKFSRNFAMAKYIVRVDPNPSHPAFISENTEFTVAEELKVQEIDFLMNGTKFTVLNDETWPNDEFLGLNESQYRAYRLALTREFAVIQGPPGTGKTFLGVKVAQTLLLNLNEGTGAKLLVICYTNHALDQFLEALLPVTKSIVRVGGQSRNQTLEEYNLNKLRRLHTSGSAASRMFNEQKKSMKLSLLAIKMQYERLDKLQNSILSFETITKYVPDLQRLAYYIHGKQDPLKIWLYEKMPFSDPQTILARYVINKKDINVDDDINRRDDVKLNDFFDEEDYENYANMDKDLKVTFSLDESEEKIKSIISAYRKRIVNNAKKTSVIFDLESEIIRLDAEIQLFKNMRALRRDRNKWDIANIKNILNVPIEERWKLYFSWLDLVIEDVKAKIKPLEKPLDFETSIFEESRMIMDMEIIKEKEVIGLTTTGAARLRTMLQEIAAPIVIVEEAAEVFEAHIVTSLTQHCKHLILIGDHQQLRPSAAHARLARHFNMEVSLFERMILNGVHSVQLGVQHRMRPLFAELISPHIYEHLDNHPSVERFPDVKGMCNNLFFFSHNHPEETVEDSASKTNHAEADLVLGLANYLMQQGYDPEEVTVLAAYSGQMFYMRTQRHNYSHLEKVKITVVDNYQGEESKIILLSLVRNNSLNKIGFLGTKNRICVALSRAREGFYIFGNMDILKSNSELWGKIEDTLEDGGNIGSELKLKCERHPFHITTVAKLEDFNEVPQGGCKLRCDKTLSGCGHQCPLLCHGYDEEHKIIKCNLPCERILCDQEHVCPLRCSVKCGECMVSVERELRCGHTQLAPCHQLIMLIKCTTFVTIKLKLCGHEAIKHCHVPESAVRCSVPCGVRVDACGHACARFCHLNDDPQHLQYVCNKPCARAKKGCTAELTGDRGEHQCQKRCYEPCDECKIPMMRKRSSCKHSIKVACNADLDSIPCRQKCARSLPCGHFCKKKCHEPCGDCTQMVKKTVPECNHEIEIECGLKPISALCGAACVRQLSCGHTCGARCGDACDSSNCRQRAVRSVRAPCGHDVLLPCHLERAIRQGREEPDAALPHCENPCGVTLACGHMCGGKCGECAGGALHRPCASACQRVLVCGHACDEPCSQVCPPCRRRCEVRCPHSRCANECGVPCTPCTEPCGRACEHGACGRRCGERCVFVACLEPCSLQLACGHTCAGLCGDPCPLVCRICKPDSVPKGFLEEEYDEDARFVALADCPHVLEASELAQWVRSSLESEHVALPGCPKCRRPLLNTKRYKDDVTRVFREQINPIKTKLYGTTEDINKKTKELKEKLLKILPISIKIPYILKDSEQWKKVFLKIKKYIDTNKRKSLLELNMTIICADVLEMLASCYDNFMKENLTELKIEILRYVKAICFTLHNSTSKLSEQQQTDIHNEIKRIHSVVQLSKILSKYPTAVRETKVLRNVIAAKSAVLTWGRFEETAALGALRELQTAMKASVTIDKLERAMVVKAMGMVAGHWFKCPAGHPYYIGECGGAMQEGRCNECGARVGGTHHTLVAGNAHAPEMDGSRYPAWSDAANMNNYQL